MASARPGITESALRVRSVLDNKTWGSAEGVGIGSPRSNTPSWGSWGPKMAISLETSSKNEGFIDLVLASLLEGPKTAQHSPTRRPKRAPRWPKLASRWPQNCLQEGSRTSKMISKTAQERPRGYKTVKSAPRRPKIASRRPKRLQRSHERAPRGHPEMAPRGKTR